MSARGVSLIEPWCAHTCSFSCRGFAGCLRGRRGFVVAMSGSVGEMIAQDQASPAWGFLACPSMWGLPSYGWLRGYHWNRHSIDEKLAISYGYTGASTANPPRRHTVFRLTFRSPTYSLRILLQICEPAQSEPAFQLIASFLWTNADAICRHSGGARSNWRSLDRSISIHQRPIIVSSRL